MRRLYACLVPMLAVMSGCGGGAGLPEVTIGFADIAGHGLFLVAGTGSGSRAMLDAGGGTILTADQAAPSAEPDGVLAESAELRDGALTVTETHRDADGDGHADIHRFVFATTRGSQISRDVLSGSLTVTRAPGIAATVPATAYRLPAPHPTGRIDAVAHPLWEDGDGHRYALAAPVAPHVVVGAVSSDRPGFAGGTWVLYMGSWLTLQGTVDSGGAQIWRLGGTVRDAGGSGVAGVSSYGPDGEAPRIDRSAELVAVPAGSG